MVWNVELFGDFSVEAMLFSEEVREELAFKIRLLQEFGPQLSRPHVDTLNASKHANMKELRFDADNGVWRVAFAFDPERKAILLVAGDKSGGSQTKFYKALIKRADKRFDEHLKETEQKKG